jgi:hypothetical protein
MLPFIGYDKARRRELDELMFDEEAADPAVRIEWLDHVDLRLRTP